LFQHFSIAITKLTTISSISSTPRIAKLLTIAITSCTIAIAITITITVTVTVLSLAIVMKWHNGAGAEMVDC
jgi:hypothetical protein